MKCLTSWLAVPLVVIALVSGARAEDPPATLAEPTFCESPRVNSALRDHVRAHHRLDAHGLAQFLLALCPDSGLRPRWKILDSLVLEELDQPTEAQSILWEVATSAPSQEQQTAAALLARSFLLGRNDQAFSSAILRLPSATATRLRLLAALSDEERFHQLAREVSDARLAEAATGQFVSYQRGIHSRRPWLAGTLSAILPGAGQAYSGSWQGAAVAFVLNAVLIGATAELAYRHLYVTATAAGVAASFFYVGNVLNAADLAQRRNDVAAAPSREALERVLLPEAFP